MTGEAQAAIRRAWDAAYANQQEVQAGADAFNSNWSGIELRLEARFGKDADRQAPEVQEWLGEHLPDKLLDEDCLWGDRLLEAEERMFMTRAPDLPALLVKFERMTKSLYPEEAAEEVLADLRYLVGVDRQRLTGNDAWQAYRDAIEAQVASERDPSATTERRCALALDAHRAWTDWLRSTDQSRSGVPLTPRARVAKLRLSMGRHEGEAA